MEFALVLPLLLLVVFGIVNYGFWFSDSLSVRQGVREGARSAVVLTVATGCTGTGMAAYACGTRNQMLTSGSVKYAEVWAPNGWARGQELVVCGVVQAINLTGFVPLPADGLIKSKTTMSIENVVPMPADTSYADTPPSGGGWSWCTA